MHEPGRYPWKHLRDPLLVAVLAILLAVKFGFLAAFGPGQLPDSSGYITFAHEILRGTSWRTGVPTDQAMPLTAFRAIGYPMLLAAAMTIAPELWPWLVAGLQIVVSTAALVICFPLARALGAGRRLAALAVLAAGTSVSLPLDLSLLTDSLTASCLIAALGLLSLGAAARRSLGWGEALVTGLLLAAAMLLREGTAVLAVLFVVPLAVRFALTPGPRRWRTALAAVLVFLPLAATSQVYQAWNESRTGHRFVTTGGQTTYLQALVKAARYDPAIFGKPAPLDRIAREEVREHSFAEVLRIIDRLHAEERLTAPSLAALMQQRYIAAWRDHPAAMMRMTLRHFRENLLFLAVRPIESAREATVWITGASAWPPYSELRSAGLRDGQTGTIMLFALQSVERALAPVVTLIFLIAPIWILPRLVPGPPPPREHGLCLLSLWLVYFGFLFAHAMIHLELRYVAPVLPFLLVVAAAGVPVLKRRLRFSRAPSGGRRETAAARLPQ